MNKKVCIKISGIHLQEEENEEGVEVINFGTYSKRNGKHYIKYEEPVENTDRTTTTILKISETETEVIVKGEVGSHLIFTEGKKNTSVYSTPFGTLNLGIDTSEVIVEEEEDYMKVSIQYSLEINLNFVADCNVLIEVESLNE